MSVGMGQLLLVLLLVLIIFGAGKLPKVMGDLGRGMRSFKEGMNEGDTNASDKRIADDKLPASDQLKDSQNS